MKRYNIEFEHKKKVIAFIFGYRCKFCGVYSHSNHVHHINGNHFDNDVFNLILLCKRCHKLTHRNISGIELNYSNSEGFLLMALQDHWNKLK